jgi:2-(1,2-epoxy-1,2-dihydrophenyl)acetyl-CoA isomerase
MEFQSLLLDINGPVATVTMNRPAARNAMDRQLRTELRHAIDALNADDSIRCIVLAASGAGFCAGTDLMERDPDSDEDGYVTRMLRAEYHTLMESIAHADKPVVAAVNGAAAGIGASLALVCDMIVMAEDAFFYSAFGAISLIPDGGLHKHLLINLGPQKAFEMIALSQRLDAATSLQMGMANRVVPSEQLLSAAQALAAQLASCAPLTLKHAKKVLRFAEDHDLFATMEEESVHQNVCFTSEDFKEGASAFFQKRAPAFKGK